MGDSISTLLSLIRKRCIEREWFGADFAYEDCMNPWMQREDVDTADPLFFWCNTSYATERRRFFRPPATADDIRLTEEALQVAFPPLLRALYCELANGGFGPGFGLFGAPGAALRFPWEDCPPSWFAEFRDTGPDGWIPLCNWGCAYDSVLDTRSGQVLCPWFSALESPNLEEWIRRWATSDYNMPRLLHSGQLGTYSRSRV